MKGAHTGRQHGPELLLGPAHAAPGFLGPAQSAWLCCPDSCPGLAVTGTGALVWRVPKRNLALI